MPHGGCSCDVARAMPDPYAILGVSREASAAEIKEAYRRLAKTLHPDRHPGDPTAAERFKEISRAYDLLRDGGRRRRYDNGEIDAEGRPRRPGFRPWAGAPADRDSVGHDEAERQRAGADIDDLVAEMLGTLRKAGRKAFRSRGRDIGHSLSVGFLDALRGGTQRLSLPDGRALDVRLPPGLRDGQRIRLRGQGEPGSHGGEAGDLLLTIEVQSDPAFRREGDDIHLDLPISLAEAVAGARLCIPTIDGPVTMTVPKGAHHGRPLRLKGKGAPIGTSGRRGDQYVRLRIVLPEPMDAELERMILAWAARHPPGGQ